MPPLALSFLLQLQEEWLTLSLCTPPMLERPPPIKTTPTREIMPLYLKQSINPKPPPSPPTILLPHRLSKHVYYIRADTHTQAWCTLCITEYRQLLTVYSIQREDYDLAAKIRDDLTRVRGVDVHELKRQLDSAIASENYNVRVLSLYLHVGCAVEESACAL